MNAYAGTGFMCSLHAPDAHSGRVVAWLKRQRHPLPFTGLHRLEFRNALRLRVGGKSPGEAAEPGRDSSVVPSGACSVDERLSHGSRRGLLPAAAPQLSCGTLHKLDFLGGEAVEVMDEGVDLVVGGGGGVLQDGFSRVRGGGA